MMKLVKRAPPPSNESAAQDDAGPFAAGTKKIEQRMRDLAMKDYQGLAAKIRIDQNQLDRCIVDQASVFLDICERHAVAVSVRDGAKDALAKADAEIARDLRISAIKNGEKLTEKMIDDQVCLHEKHQTAAAAYADARRDEAQWGNLRDAFDQRMRMLRELVQLYAAGYWTNSGTMNARDQHAQQTAQGIQEAMQRKREERQGGQAGGG